MHDVAPSGISTEMVRNDLTESPGEQSFVDIPYRGMYILLGSGNPAHGITVGSVHGEYNWMGRFKWNEGKDKARRAAL